MSIKRYIVLGLSALLFVVALQFALPSKTSAITSLTGGDGFVPFTYQGKVFNIFHHKSISGDANNPNFDIACTQVSGQSCSNYPRYFSSDNGSSGALGVGTPGTADIYTSAMPNATIIGSHLFYAGQRAADNGIGCFDLDTGTNCGYFPLGSLTLRTGFLGVGWPSKVDGIEQVGNKLYSIGDDLKMYCLDVSDVSSPVACSGQPFAVNTGVPLLPAAVQSMAARIVHDNKIYISVNYNSNIPAADARVTCYDPATDSRCAGWTSLDVTGTSDPNSVIFSLFNIPDTSGNNDAFCTTVNAGDPLHCWNYATQSSVSGPANLFAGLTPKLPVLVRNVLQVGNKSYFALEAQSLVTQDGIAYCYDFTTQTACSGFGVNGAKRWDGSDGGTAVNNGITREYGYAQYSSTCLIGLGDAGVLWSFDSRTGKVLNLLDCSDAVATAVIPKAAPDTGSQADIRMFAVASFGLLLAGLIGWRYTYKTIR